MRRYLALKERQKSAGRGDAVGAEAHELGGSVEKLIEQSFRLVADDAVRRGPGDDLVEDGKRPGQGIAHITGNTRKPRLEHQDADPGAVKGLAAPGDPRSISHSRAIHWLQTMRRRRLPVCDLPSEIFVSEAATGNRLQIDAGRPSPQSA